jgi:hypothetical protein
MRPKTYQNSLAVRNKLDSSTPILLSGNLMELQKTGKLDRNSSPDKNDRRRLSFHPQIKEKQVILN